VSSLSHGAKSAGSHAAPHPVSDGAQPPSSLQTLKDLLGTIRDVAFIVAIYAFFTGFIYRYYYLDRLGVPPNYDDKALFSIFVYSYTVTQDCLQGLLQEVVRITPEAIILHLFSLLFIFAASFTVYAQRGKATSLIREYPWVTLALASFTALLLFPLLAGVAANAAVADADSWRNPFMNKKSSAVILTQGARSSYDPDFVDFIQHAYAIQLVSETSENDYFLQVDNTSSSVQHAFVFAIPRTDIARIATILSDQPILSDHPRGAIHP
jgi:hypothetical protein